MYRSVLEFLYLNVIIDWCPFGYEIYFRGLSREEIWSNLFNALLARVLWLFGREDSDENIAL